MRQKLGQHFLAHPETAQAIVAGLGIRAGETVIEIGGGRGALTAQLWGECEKKKAKLVVIEKDRRLASELYESYHLKAQIVPGDALSIIPELVSSIGTDSYAIVGNIPYYITGQLLRVLGELSARPRAIVLMLQKEVAQRLAADSSSMNKLAASVQRWGDVEVILSVPKKYFSPAPDVDSAVVRITPVPKPFLSDQDARDYYEMMRIIFKQPRKTLQNNLTEGLAGQERYQSLDPAQLRALVAAAIRKGGYPDLIRGQNLSIPDIIAFQKMLLPPLKNKDKKK